MTKDNALPPSGRSESEPRADAAHAPLAQAARCLEKTNRPFEFGDPVADGLVRELEASFAQDDSELMLYTQIRVLDALFKRLIAHDVHGPYASADGIPCLRDEKLLLALRAQKQSRVAIEALMRLRARKEAEDE